MYLIYTTLQVSLGISLASNFLAGNFCQLKGVPMQWHTTARMSHVTEYQNPIEAKKIKNPYFYHMLGMERPNLFLKKGMY